MIILLLFSACGGDAPANNETNETSKTVSPEPIEPIKIEPQLTFDQSQLTSKVLGLCVKFKTLDGADRKHVFDQFEVILPSCPVEVLEDNSTKMLKDDAQQIMTLYDLKELLGNPNEIRENGDLVYNLMADASYQVLFIPEPDGSIACRYYEAES